MIPGGWFRCSTCGRWLSLGSGLCWPCLVVRAEALTVVES